MSRLDRLPLRTRLVAGFVVAMLVLLTAAGAFVYWRVQYALDRGLDTRLGAARESIAPLVGTTGRVTDPEAASASGTAWQVLAADGTVLDSGGGAPATPLVPRSVLAGAGPGTTDVDLGGGLLDRADHDRVRLARLDGGSYLLVAVPRGPRDEALRELLLQLALAGAGSLVVAGVVGDRLARAALRPVERFRVRSEEIAAGGSGLRLEVPAGRDDEVTRLGHTLNEMLTALETSLDHERRFVDEASHELRTPLTLLRSRIQLARRRPRTVLEHEEVLAELEVDVQRLADLADQLLELGGGSGAGQTDGAGSDAGQVAAALVGRRRLAQDGSADELVADLAAGPVPAALDTHALERVVTNLVENALRHGRPPVHVRTRAVAGPDDGGWAVVEVADAGPGMSPELLATATDRFVRSAESRSRPGAGLGLSLVAALVTRSGGELRLCHAGRHVSHGRPAPVACGHDDTMTVTVLLPAPA